MTREEAIAILEVSKHMATSGRMYNQAIDMAIEALSADAVQGEWEFVDNEIFAGEYFCSICGKRAEVDLYGEWILSNFCPMCGAEMADNSLVNDITESSNDVVESKDDVIEVVRCKDCRHGQYDATHYFCAEHYHKVYEDDYCSHGERRCNYFGERREP